MARVENDLAEAVKWFREAAELHNADAQFLLGVFYAIRFRRYSERWQRR
jgi:TPR repeat protein